MKTELFPFQQKALTKLHEFVGMAHNIWSESSPSVISFSAPTGSGKTIIMSGFIEDILTNGASNNAKDDTAIAGNPNAIFVWLSNDPELNEQSRLKIEKYCINTIPLHRLVQIDGSFDNGELLEPGKVYFINTQLLGVDKNLTNTSETRPYSIWDTFSNTAKRWPKDFYFIIDEAHQGAKSNNTIDSSVATSIMQRFLKGGPNNKPIKMPLVIGMTATSKRFDDMLTGIDSIKFPNKIEPKEVRDSGLLKEHIIIKFPDKQEDVYTTFEIAVLDWLDYCDKWKYYHENEERGGDKEVNPILLVQVEDKNKTSVSATDILACVEIIERHLNRKLELGEIVHTFDVKKDIEIGTLKIPYLKPSRIQEEETVKIVLFKTNLQTGWDCPRAETMVSFRKAQEYTYVAQLLGRMIRTPLAHSIPIEPELNNVRLFLPLYDTNTVNDVVGELERNEAFSKDKIVTSSYVTLRKNGKYLDVFEKLSNLSTFFVPSSQKKSSRYRYLQLSRFLSNDGLVKDALSDAKEHILSKIEEIIKREKETGLFEESRKKFSSVALDGVIYKYGESSFSPIPGDPAITTIDVDINKRFEESGRILGEGLHIDYWKRHSDIDELEIKFDIIVFVNNVEAISQLEYYCEELYNSLYDSNKNKIGLIHPVFQRDKYKRLLNASLQPKEIPWCLNDKVEYIIHDKDIAYDKHMYVDDNGIYKASLNTWERDVLQEEINNVIYFWLRNPVKKDWSYIIPYENEEGIIKPMFVDFIVIRRDNTNSDNPYIFDILEPHDPSLNDNVPKIRGLARFAEKYNTLFGRIQLIRKMKRPDGKEHYVRLDLAKTSVWKAVLTKHDNVGIDDLFKTMGSTED